MRVWAVHTVFAAILIGSLATQERAAEVLVVSDSLEPGVLRVARSHGLDFREYRTKSGTVLRALVFEAPSCSRPVIVNVRLGTFEEESVQSAPDQGYVRRYYYIERSWDAPAPHAVWAERMKYAALAMFGLTVYVPSRYLLLVDAPPRCQAAETVDWRPVWNRVYLAAAQADTEATTANQ
jgi:hypothetical protein